MRLRGRAFNLSISHVACQSGDLVRARSVLDTPGAARWLRFPFLALHPFPDIAGFPAVGDLGQDFPHSFNVSLRPRVNLEFAYRDNPWCWYFLFGDIAAQS